MPQLQWENLASVVSLGAGIVAVVLQFCGVVPLKLLNSIESRIRALSAYRAVCLLLVAMTSFAINAAIAWHNGIPTPKIHDEFSYLLAADTFSHGRLTNPTPVFPASFETPQELTTPTRMSKYPPGQGIALMLGEVGFGEPIVGVWISTALACAAIYWMLLAFVRQPWALLGGVMAAWHPTLLDWSQVYWGGSVAVLGGALVIGAWGRLMQSIDHISALWLGIGLAILANSRPFEGSILSVPLMFALLTHTRIARSARVIPLLVVLLAAVVAMACYNLRITGHPFRLPYVEYISQYAVYPLFWFEGLKVVPEYHNASLRWVHTVLDRYDYDDMRQFRTFWHIALHRASDFIMRNIKLGVLLPPLVVGIFTLRDRRLRWVLVAASAVFMGILAEVVALPHYSAPATAALLLLVTVGCQRLRPFQLRSRAVGVAVTRAIGFGLCFGVVMSAAQGVSQDSRIVDQQTLIRLKPSLQGGRHLIFVDYKTGYQMGNEFVYNAADIEQSRIIWVHSLGAAKDASVAAHFTGRHFWLLEAGKALNLTPYTPRDVAIIPSDE